MRREADTTQPAHFEDYLALVEPAFKPQLQELRTIVKSIVPDAEESISYQVPCFKHIYMLVGVGVNKKFCSLYTMSPGLVKEMKEELAGYKVSGATLHFDPSMPLPEELIRKIVLARKKENEILALTRKKGK